MGVHTWQGGGGAHGAGSFGEVALILKYRINLLRSIALIFLPTRSFYDMVWYGMVWYGMVWYGMVWYGMV